MFDIALVWFCYCSFEAESHQCNIYEGGIAVFPGKGQLVYDVWGNNPSLNRESYITHK
jgi:hypothetical protein